MAILQLFFFFLFFVLAPDCRFSAGLPLNRRRFACWWWNAGDDDENEDAKKQAADRATINGSKEGTERGKEKHHP